MSAYDPRLANLVAELNCSATGSAHATVPVADTSSIDRILLQAAKRAASDVLIIADTPVILRLNGTL